MQKRTALKLACLYDEWVANGSSTNGISGSFADVIQLACREEIEQRYYSLAPLWRENAAESVAYKIKIRLANGQGTKIKCLGSFICEACKNAAITEARKGLTPLIDSKTGKAVVSLETGKVVQVPKEVSGDEKKRLGDNGDGVAIFDDLQNPSSLETDGGILFDRRELLFKIDKEIAKLPDRNTRVFKMTINGCSALDTAREVFDSKVTDSDSPSIKKMEQNRVSTIVNRVRQRIFDKFGRNAVELGILSQRRYLSR